MSKKHPGRNTDYAKWVSIMAKLDNALRKEYEIQKKESKEGDVRNSKKRIKTEEEDI